jgi:hypothetical protein
MKSQNKIKKLSDDAYIQYMADPDNEEKKRLYRCIWRLEQYEKLPFEWREAVKDELDKRDKGIEIEYFE